MIDPNKLCLGCMNELEEENKTCKICGWNNEADENNSHQLKCGTVLQGKYLVGKVLGEGGFGITYLGWNLFAEDKIAIKEFYPHGFVGRDSTIKSTVLPYVGHESTAEKAKESFVKEAKTLFNLNSIQGVVEVKDIFSENQTVYIVMSFIEGETLKEYAKENGNKLSMSKVLELLAPVMYALEQVHAQGLIHRDISPDNIMIGSDGKVTLVDFGAARQISEDGGHSLTVNLKHGYAPVEQYQTHGKQGPWTDVYALCATIYRLITGKIPVSAVDRIVEDTLTLPRVLSADITEEQEKILMKGLSPNIQDRYLNVSELREAFYGKSEDTVPALPIVATEDNDEKEEIITEDFPENKYKNRKHLKIGIAIIASLLAFGVLFTVISGNMEKTDVLRPDEMSNIDVEKNDVESNKSSVPEKQDWSEWSEKLPKKVDESKYDIEEKILYSSRKLETTTSNSKVMIGWELFDEAEDGGYGPWNDWSQNVISATDNREVETEARYRYRDKETTIDSSSVLAGWTHYDTTYEYGDYGNWSEWDTTSVSSNDNRKVETKTQYSYREKLYGCRGPVEAIDGGYYLLDTTGWTYYKTVTSYGEWSEWINTDGGMSIPSYSYEIEEREIEGEEKFQLAHYCTKNGVSYNKGYPDTIAKHVLGWFTASELIQYEDAWGYSSGACSNGASRYYVTDTQKTVVKQYRWRHVYKVDHYYKWDEWSSYSDTVYTPSEDREVQTRTMYRYCEREQIPVYHFYRWGSWSEWSTTKYQTSNSREVESATYYRYRDRVMEKTYYFRRWTEWSDYSENPITPSEYLDVRTKTVYRYKPKF
ncbi:MAG: serine/threonine protein kinase [Ruminococcaceae bacterium]|nr:serine/threonine protein kinase [Oscillospiraceae bacterium]